MSNPKSRKWSFQEETLGNYSNRTRGILGEYRSHWQMYCHMSRRCQLACHTSAGWPTTKKNAFFRTIMEFSSRAPNFLLRRHLCVGRCSRGRRENERTETLTPHTCLRDVWVSSGHCPSLPAQHWAGRCHHVQALDSRINSSILPIQSAPRFDGVVLSSRAAIDVKT